MKTQIHSSRSGGFALVVTLLMMVLLTIVALGLLTLSTISLRSAGQGDAAATARANARLALMLAIGDLQKSLGPDRAITANSEILTATPAKPNTAGVWQSWSDFDPNQNPKYSEKKTSNFRRWLVSSADQADTESKDFVKDAWKGKTIELVGNGSLGANAKATEKATAGLVPVSQNGKIQGSYAWHVSDESVKARINAYRDPSQNTTLAQKRALLAGHRPDPSVIVAADSTSPTYLPNDLTPAEYTKAKDSSGKLIDRDQLELLDQAKGKTQKYRNDVTPFSLGLMTDVRHGGLKQDLSSMFEMSALPTAFSTASGRNLYKSTTPSHTGVSDPYWSTLSSYYNYYNKNNAQGSTETNPTVALSATALSVTANKVPQSYLPGPVIAKVEMLFSLVTREAASCYLGAGYVTPDVRAAMNTFDDTVNVIFTPQITLHNPYNVSISFHKMVVTIKNIPIAFKFTLLPGGSGQQSQSVVPNDFESMNEWISPEKNDVSTNVPGMLPGDKFFKLQISNWKNANRDNTETDEIVMKPGEVLVCTPFLDTNGTFLKDSRSDEDNDVFDWTNKITSSGSGSGIGEGVKMKPLFTTGLGFESNGVTPSCRSSSAGGFTNWEILLIRDPIRARTGVQPAPYEMDDTNPSPGHPVDKYFVEFQAQRPKFRRSGGAYNDVAPSFQVNATLESTPNSAPVDYASLQFDYTNDAKLKSFFNSRVYRCPADPNDYLTGENTFVSAKTKIDKQGKTLPFAVFSAYARTTNGGVYETNKRIKTGADTPQINLLKDGTLAGKPFLFHNPSRAVVTMDLASDKPGIQPYEVNLQPFLSKGDYEKYMEVDGNRVPALTGNRTVRGIKSGSYLEIPTGPMQTIADFRRSNALSSSYLPHFVQPVSNSLLHPLMSPNKVIESNTSISATTLLDHSVLANHALYDQFYFSTFATRGSAKPDAVFEQFMNGTAPLANQSFQSYLPVGKTTTTAKAELYASGMPKNDSYKYAAEYQMVKGPFNVNSTNIQAWKAVLASMKKSEVATLWAKNASVETKATPGTPIFAMSLLNGGLVGGAIDSAKIDDPKTNEWNGYHELSDAQLTTLATKIVEQVRLRGPFLSMSEFVNRQVGPLSALSLSGALENAIIDSGINDNTLTSITTPLTVADVSDPALYNYKTPTATIGNPAAGAPGWISQGDLLRILEPSATVRSDTFVIRVCGEAQDVNGVVTARAYAEAVVQRVPEYVDPVDRPSVNAYDITAPTAVKSPAAPANKTFGRRMNVVSFRWLSATEI
jgi:hypothetical protein